MSRIDYDALMALRDLDRPFAYDERDTMLYALAAGMASDPLDRAELPFVFEGRGLTALPSMAVAIARSPLPRTLPIDMTKVLHGEQSLVLHRTLPPSARLLADTRLTRIIDKGEGRGAIIHHETVVRLDDDGAPLFTTGGSLFARADGGFGGSPDAAPPRRTVPDRAPDLEHAISTRPDQALLYRLTGDRNPIHADPDLARQAGFDRPILHGLCSFAVATRAILAAVCGHDAEKIAGLAGRFTKPVFPGETIVTDLWVDGRDIAFRCRVAERDVVVIDDGRCVIR